ncbi:hypothetical protein [Actinomyces oris]|uniref:hypothetical protein n=1 Tax=Actinomyces oris TaxID=544580 RepID=UPI0028D0B655|nr:hypothetical protein [Actinomyces oris]
MNLQPQIKSTFKMDSLNIGLDSGESFRPTFHAPGSAVAQLSVGQPVVASS